MASSRQPKKTGIVGRAKKNAPKRPLFLPVLKRIVQDARGAAGADYPRACTRLSQKSTAISRITSTVVNTVLATDSRS